MPASRRKGPPPPGDILVQAEGEAGGLPQGTVCKRDLGANQVLGKEDRRQFWWLHRADDLQVDREARGGLSRAGSVPIGSAERKALSETGGELGGEAGAIAGRAAASVAN